MITLTPKQKIAWQEHLERPELRRHLFYGGARSGKTDVILAWLCVQADCPPKRLGIGGPPIPTRGSTTQMLPPALAGFRWRFWTRPDTVMT